MLTIELVSADGTDIEGYGKVIETIPPAVILSDIENEKV
jgi:hypothetical protein